VDRSKAKVEAKQSKAKNCTALQQQVAVLAQIEKF